MATEAQIRANQENAQKSRGPKTEEGKQRSSMNATTHGIFARIPILPEEDQEFLKAIADDIYNTYKPKDAMEVILVERITIAYFKQVRLRNAEEITDLIKSGNIKSAHERCERLNQDDKLGVWSLLNAKTKLALKKYLEAKDYILSSKSD